LRIVPRRHHEVGEVAATVRAPEPQLDQRHITAAGVDQRMRIRVGLVAARLSTTRARGRSVLRGAGRASGCIAEEYGADNEQLRVLAFEQRTSKQALVEAWVGERLSEVKR
jgi:hypothetical protein